MILIFPGDEEFDREQAIAELNELAEAKREDHRGSLVSYVDDGAAPSAGKITKRQSS